MKRQHQLVLDEHDGEHLNCFCGQRREPGGRPGQQLSRTSLLKRRKKGEVKTVGYRTDRKEKVGGKEAQLGFVDVPRLPN